MKKFLLVLLSLLSLTCFITACNENNNEVCSHTYGEWNIVDEATCLEDGLKSHTCAKCGDIETQIVEAFGHTEVLDARIEPTCTSTGLTEGKHCSSCGTVFINQEAIDQLEHIEIVHEAKTPTCANVGWSEYVTCERKGCQYSTYSEIPATGNHTWNSGEITTQPTCTQKGVKTFTCTKCKITTKIEDIKALGHDEEFHESKAPTCANIGWSEYVTCQRDGCNYSTYNEIAATGNHAWNSGEITTKPTCIKKGVKTFTCTKCKITTKTEDIKALGHNEVIDKRVESTCLSTGLTEGKHCSICQAVLVQQTTINKINHNYVNGACIVCSTADMSYKNIEIENEKTRHNNEIIEINTFYESTIEALEERVENLKLLNNISSVYSDSYCYSMINSLNSEIATLERKIAVLAGSTNSADIAERRNYESQLSAKQQERDIYYKHIAINDCIMQINEYELYWENDIENENQKHIANLDKIEKKYYCAANGHTTVVDIAVTMTCTTDGFTEGSHCSYCGQIFVAQEKIPASGHKYSEWEKVLDASCTQDGLEQRECANCSNIEKNILSRLQHSLSAEATCTSDQICTVCKTIIVPRHHTLSDEWIIEKEVSFEDSGKKYQECLVCKEKCNYITIPMLKLKVSICSDGETYSIIGLDTGNVESIVIPELYNGKTISHIKSLGTAIYIKKLVIPKTVTKIDEGALKGLTNLEELEIPFVGNTDNSGGINCLFGFIFGYSSQYTSGATTQYYDNSKYPVNAPKYYYFMIPTTLNKVTVYNTLCIPAYSFNRCRGFELVLGDSVTTIGKKAFEASSLDNIVLSNRLGYIYDEAFRDSSIKEIVLPASLRYIGAYAFVNCYSLNKVTFLNTSNWKVYLTATTYDGTSVYVGDAQNNASLLTDTWRGYCDYIWKC